MLYRLGDRRVTLEGSAFVAANATVVGSVVLKDQSSVWFGSIVRGDSDLITIGAITGTVEESLETTDSGLEVDELAGVASENLRHMEGLRKETFDLTGTSDSHLVFF